MPDQTPKELLQPCLLDRLTDDEPQALEEGRAQRVVSFQKYRRGVLRDLHWLFSTTATLRVEETRGLRKADFGEAWSSVLNYGTRQLTGLVEPDTAKLQEELTEAIKFFEPRVLPRTLTVKAGRAGHALTFEVDGELWANPMPEHLHVSTRVDLETGQLLGDAPHG